LTGPSGRKKGEKGLVKGIEGKKESRKNNKRMGKIE